MMTYDNFCQLMTNFSLIIQPAHFQYYLLPPMQRLLSARASWKYVDGISQNLQSVSPY